MTKSFEDKVILILGEVSELSMGIIHSFLKEMAIVIFPAKSLRDINLVKSFRDINAHKNLITLLVDVQDFDKLIETCETINDKFTKIDIAIEIPEFSSSQKNLTETSIDEWNTMIERDMAPFFIGARIVLNVMKGNLSGMFVHVTDSRFFENLSSCALARIAFTTRLEMSKIFAEEAHKHGIRYYHLWAQNAAGGDTFLLAGGTPDKNAEMISAEIMQLYKKETYNINAALQSFPKQLLHQQA